MVLAILLAVIVAVVLIIVKPGTSQGARSANQVSVPKDLGDASATGKAALKDIPACTANQLEVIPVTDQTDYAADQLPQLAMLLKNKGDADCVADLGTADMLFSITSGGVAVWNSADCQTDGDHKKIIIDAGKQLSTATIEWDRTRSSKETCETERPAAEPGSYHLQVEIGGFKSKGTQQFILN